MCKSAGFCHTAPKTIFFSKCFEKMIFPNKYAEITCFFYYHTTNKSHSQKISLKLNIFFMILAYYVYFSFKQYDIPFWSLYEKESSHKHALKFDAFLVID